MPWFWIPYLRDGIDLENFYGDPLKANDFDGLPPVTVMTARLDPFGTRGSLCRTIGGDSDRRRTRLVRGFD